MTAEWNRMLQFWGITDAGWPFEGVKGWKQKLHDWIEDNVDDIYEQKLMHEKVSNW